MPASAGKIFLIFCFKMGNFDPYQTSFARKIQIFRGSRPKSFENCIYRGRIGLNKKCQHSVLAPNLFKFGVSVAAGGNGVCFDFGWQPTRDFLENKFCSGAYFDAA